MRKPTLGSLFSGAGGFDYGFDQAGFDILFQVEIDKTARSVLSRHWPDVPKFDDVCKVGKKNLSPVDVIIGGWPCQDLSTAGKRAGLTKGKRSSLFYQFVRVIRGLRPLYVCWENVPGLLTSDEGRDFARVLMELDRSGYSGAWRSLDAQFFGVAQQRVRVFGVFAKRSIGARSCSEILDLPKSRSRNTPKSRKAKTDAARTTTNGTRRVGRTLRGQPNHSHREDSDNLIVYGGQNRERGGNASLTTKGQRLDFDSENFVLIQEEVRAFASNDFSTGSYREVSVSPPISTNTDPTRGTPIVNLLYYSHDYNQDRVYGTDGPTPALTANDSNRTRNQVVAGTVRRLTPRECERLQGWPDDWTRWRSDNSEIADGPRYRMIGNGVTAPVAHWIATRLMKELSTDG